MATINLVPIISEKAYSQANTVETYTFEVPISASKTEIAKAVEQQFSVKVNNVRTSTLKGKQVASMRRRNRPMPGFRAKTKKAYVSLVKGDKINIYEGVEE